MPMPTLANLRKELKSKTDPKRAKILQGFFKTGPGEYGEGDVFWGLTASEIRMIALKYRDIKFPDMEKLLRSKIHEERVAALRILIYKFQQMADSKKKIFDFYLKNTKYINNWDLVDMSADKIMGEYLLDKPKTILYKLAKSKSLWERRIAIIATFQFIKNNQFTETIKISEMLLGDEHDLIHKAVGWMLREVGKRSQSVEEKFLNRHYKKMHRTMLRYAIERFSEKKRQAYLKSRI